MLERRRSFTSDLVAALRALYSEVPLPLEVAGDPVARGLLDGPLASFLDGVKAVPGGPLMAHRAIGELTLGLSYGVPLRTAAIDAGLRKRLSEGVEQLVVLGAGLDARAWRLPELRNAHVFELDHPNTQEFKRRAVGTLPPLAARLSWCSIDFERQTVPEVLGDSDFDPGAPSLWVWEGVTMYLTPEAIDGSLEAVAELTAPGSQVQITYLPPDYGPAAIRALGGGLAGLVGEPLKGATTRVEMQARLEALGFSVESDTTSLEWTAEYWPESERKRARAWEHLVVANRD